MRIRLRRRWPLCLGAALLVAGVVTGLPTRQVGADSDSFLVDPSSGGSPCPIAHCNQHLDGRKRFVIPTVGRAADVPGPIVPGGVSATSGVSWTQQAELTPTAQMSVDGFGGAVAASGDTIVVGAAATPDFEGYGATYIFVRSGGTWTQQAAFADPGGMPNDQFGISVAIDGDTAVIGALGEAGAVAHSGAAFVYVRRGGVWTEQTKLVAPDGASYDNFGSSVAISGTTILVGATGHNGGQGAAYVFVHSESGSSWSEQAELDDPGPYLNAEFGNAVALSGDTALISAVLTPLAYVFVRRGGAWSVQGVLHAPHQPGLYFGVAVALSGDTALVGACCDFFGQLRAVTFVFARSSGVWSEQATLRPPGEPTGTGFGAALALSGQTALVGGGGAYVFVYRDGSWYEQAQLTPSDDRATDLGAAVALSGQTAVASSESGATSALGVAYVFVRRPSSAAAADSGDAGPASHGG